MAGVSNSTLKRAVFLDRDGTIAPDVPYCSRAEDFELYPGAPSAIKLLKENGFKVVVITNQSGIARGYFSEETLDKIHNKLRSELNKCGVDLDALYYCPHHPDDGCDCRKPGTALFLRAKTDINLDFTQSYVIGDKGLDISAGKKTGCTTILITHGNGNLAELDVKPDYVAADMLDAAKWILGKNQGCD
jgi:D,D-heptose 1,7-bisphosphate phosphatase